MKNLRLNARVLVRHNGKLLLVRNKNANFWYPPGGGWEYEHETIQDCAIREAYEETGYQVELKHLLWVQELREKNTVYLEAFWLAGLSEQNSQTAGNLAAHIDHDTKGMVAEAKWFTQAELQHKKVFPEQAKHFLGLLPHKNNSFIGVFND